MCWSLFDDFTFVGEIDLILMVGSRKLVEDIVRVLKAKN